VIVQRCYIAALLYSTAISELPHVRLIYDLTHLAILQALPAVVQYAKTSSVQIETQWCEHLNYIESDAEQDVR
jgi:hypothetical protein